MSKEQLLSIITPTYNRADLLPNCYSSLCCQTDFDFEWIIIDDGSTDDTETVVRSFKTDKFPMIRIPELLRLLLGNTAKMQEDMGCLIMSLIKEKIREVCVTRQSFRQMDCIQSIPISRSAGSIPQYCLLTLNSRERFTTLS